jgi:hypothetical protein
MIVCRAVLPKRYPGSFTTLAQMNLQTGTGLLNVVPRPQRAKGKFLEDGRQDKTLNIFNSIPKKTHPLLRRCIVWFSPVALVGVVSLLKLIPSWQDKIFIWLYPKASIFSQST